MQTKRLLTVDWDYFFPEYRDPAQAHLWDWGHDEQRSIFMEQIWVLRAAEFIRSGLPLPGTSGEEQSFWHRFRFAPGCRLYYADSHVRAFDPKIREDVTEVWNYDAHHDAGYEMGALSNLLKREQVACDNWALVYRMMNVPVHVRYPRWKADALDMEMEPESVPHGARLDRRVDNGNLNPREFHVVMVARSGVWVPPWLDIKFMWFLRQFPMIHIIALKPGAPLRPWYPDRQQQAEEFAAQLRTSIRKFQNRRTA